MKNYFIYFTVIMLLLSCSNKEDELSQSKSANLPKELIITRTATLTGQNSTSNPELLTNWENLTQVVLSNGGREDLPWVDGTSGALPTDIAKNIKKEDGWKILFHTFTGLNENSKKNYLCFYNELTGLLKVFYFSEVDNNSNSGFLWQFKTSGDIKSSLIPDDDYFSESMNSSNKFSEIYLSPLTENGAKGVMRGWNAFQIELPYSNDYSNLYFVITGINKEITNYNFTGDFSSTTKGTIVQTNTIDGSKSNGVANSFGEKAKGFINGLGGAAKVGSLVKDAIAGIATGGYGLAIKTGLKFVTKAISAFGKSNTPTPITQDVSLKTQGKITLSGTGESVNTAQITSLSNIPLYQYNNLQFLGLWNLEKAPEVVYERYSMFVGELDSEEYFPNKGSMYYISNGTIVSPYVREGLVNVKINPAIEKYIVRKNIETSLFYYDKMDGNYYSRGKLLSLIPESEVDELYQDDQMHLLKTKSGMGSYAIPASGTIKYGYNNYYDWGPASRIVDNFIVNVMVELTYNYNGQTRTITSSRNYKPTLVEDSSLSSIPNISSNYIVKDCRY